MIDKVPIEPSERSEDTRDLIDVLDRILDKGIVVDPISRLNMMDSGSREGPREHRLVPCVGSAKLRAALCQKP